MTGVQTCALRSRQLNVSNDLEDEHDFGPAAGTTGKYEEDDDDDFEYEDDEEEDY